METLKHAHIGHANYILSTIPDLLLKGVDNGGLVRMCKALAPHATIIATADDANHEQRLRAEGATAVTRIYEVSADSLAQVLAQSNRADTETPDAPTARASEATPVLGTPVAA